jgi:hypothetical protein
MPISEETMARLRRVKTKHEDALMRKANVVGVGIGFRRRRGTLTDEPAIVVSVTHKVPHSRLDEKDIVPQELDGIPVDVEAVGRLRPLDATVG